MFSKGSWNSKSYHPEWP